MLLKDVSELKFQNPRRSRTIVIGSGAVGLYTANELAKHGLEVVVIESGGVNLESFAPETYASIGVKHDGIHTGRSKSLGGTTNLWGGQLVEFQPIDFSGRDWMPGSKWPVSYEEIAHYYKKTYENFGIEGEAQDDDRIWGNLLGVRPKFSEGLEIFLTRWLNIPSFAVAFSRQIRSSENLQVLMNHTVVGFHGSGDVNSCIKIVDRNGEKHTIEGSQFILAAGTIETVRLLLHSAMATSWDCPWRNNTNVGACFQDHLSGTVATVQPDDKKAFFDTFCTIAWWGHKYQPKVRLTNRSLEQTQILNIQGMFAFESSVSENLVYLKQFLKAAIYSRKVSGTKDLLVNLRACTKILLPLIWRYFLDHRIFVPSASTISLLIQGEQVPIVESRIKIDPMQLDGDGLPKVILDWRVSGKEIISIREFTTRCDRALQTAKLARLQINEDLMNLNPRFMSTLRDNNHQAGGALMGTSSQDGVVDSDLKVFGTTNLYIGGAAVFRTISNANITFTALAFATRLVDHLTLGQHAVH